MTIVSDKLQAEIKLRKKTGQMLEPAWLYANLPGKKDHPLMELAEIVRQFYCHGGVVHPGDVWDMYMQNCERIIAVIDFPYGRGGISSKRDQALQSLASPAAQMYVTGFDVVIDLWSFQSLLWKNFQDELKIVVQHAVKREVKAICQMPFIWQYYADRIPKLLECLVESGVSVLKDWTTINNFSLPVDVDTDTRLAYTAHIRNLIDKERLPLKLKIAGKVDHTTVVRYYEAGADYFGIGHQKTEAVFNALFGHLVTKK